MKEEFGLILLRLFFSQIDRPEVSSHDSLRLHLRLVA